MSIIFNAYSLIEDSLIAGTKGIKLFSIYIKLLIFNSLSLISDVKVENIIYMFHLACPRLCVRLKIITSHE